MERSPAQFSAEIWPRPDNFANSQGGPVLLSHRYENLSEKAASFASLFLGPTNGAPCDDGTRAAKCENASRLGRIPTGSLHPLPFDCSGFALSVHEL